MGNGTMSTSPSTEKYAVWYEIPPARGMQAYVCDAADDLHARQQFDEAVAVGAISERAIVRIVDKHNMMSNQRKE